MSLGQYVSIDGDLEIEIGSTLPPAKVVHEIGFTPISYDADLTMDGTAQSVALVTGAQKLVIINRGVTTEAIRVAFGASASAAETALGIAGGLAVTGFYWPAIADLASSLEIGVPFGSTHYAIANAVASDTQIVSITQGV